MNTIETKNLIDFSDFLKVEILVGTIIGVEPNVKAKIPAYVLKIDFGFHGVKLSSAQITQNYSQESLLGKQVLAVTNFPSKKVAGIKSEVLVLAAVCKSTGTVLIQPTLKVENGTQIL